MLCSTLHIHSVAESLPRGRYQPAVPRSIDRVCRLAEAQHRLQAYECPTWCRLFRYKDCIYAYYPLQLPRVEEGSMNVFNQGARFEMGCLCR